METRNGWDQFVQDIWEYVKLSKAVDKLKDLSDWAIDGHDFVTQNNVSDGTRPKDNVTREEVWTMLYNYHNKKRVN